MKIHLVVLKLLHYTWTNEHGEANRSILANFSLGKGEEQSIVSIGAASRIGLNMLAQQVDLDADWRISKPVNIGIQAVRM